MMQNRICYQKKVNAGKPEPLTTEKLNELLDSQQVKDVCRQIAALDRESADYEERKAGLKRQLPVLIPHACSFNGGARKSSLAVPSGLAMLDVDDVEEPRRLFEKWTAEQLRALGVCFVSVTPSGHGLRVIGERRAGESIEAAQVRMADALGIEGYDGVVKDLARPSYVVPREYVLWLDEEGLTKTRSYSPVGSDPEGEKSEEKEVAQTYKRAEERLEYKGVEYGQIVEQLMRQIGAEGGAEKGERNTVYFTLASYMRYITDFSADLLLKVLPDFGLSREERQGAIRSALGRPRKTQIPTIVQTALGLCQRVQQEEKETVLRGRANDLKLPKLPKLLRIICRRLPALYHGPMIIASLPVLGALATRIRFEYLDHQVQSLSFFSCLTAPMASGKSFIRKPIELLLTPINEQDRVEREKEQQYKETLRANKNSKLKPQDPHACPRNNGVSISVSKLVQLMTYLEGKHLIGIGEELDTLLKSEKAGAWSQKSDIYRLAFDNGKYGQNYMSDQSFSAHVPVYYNLLLTGTPNSVYRFFNDVEDGLMSRVCFSQLPDTSFTDIPQFDSYTENEKQEIIRWARQLDKEEGMIKCPQVGRVIDSWLKEKRQQALDADSQAADILRRRSGVMGFRAGMLCWLLEGRKWTKSVGEMAVWVAEYCFRNQMELFGERLEQEATRCQEIRQRERGAASSLLQLLPAEFGYTELAALRARNRQSTSVGSMKMLLSRWKKYGRVEKVEEGRWRKLC